MPMHRPRLTMTGPLLRGSGELHIVGRRDVVTIADPDGAVQRLLGLADGSQTRGELLGVLASEFSALGERGAEDLVADLEAAGVLEDAAPRGRILSTRIARRDVHERGMFAGHSRGA